MFDLWGMKWTPGFRGIIPYKFRNRGMKNATRRLKEGTAEEPKTWGRSSFDGRSETTKEISVSRIGYGSIVLVKLRSS